MSYKTNLSTHSDHRGKYSLAEEEGMNSDYFKYPHVKYSC